MRVDHAVTGSSGASRRPAGSPTAFVEGMGLLLIGWPSASAGRIVKPSAERIVEPGRVVIFYQE
jgi:hypothetical protein